MTATPVIRIKTASDQRLEVLDGMRGLAALMVVAYHFFARWAEPQFTPTLYAHGDDLATFLPLQLAGEVGVHLFFLISGFVIMMTLERATGLLDFIVKRAARLWPAMLVCATLSTLIINVSGVGNLYENVTRVWHPAIGHATLGGRCILDTVERSALLRAYCNRLLAQPTELVSLGLGRTTSALFWRRRPAASDGRATWRTMATRHAGAA